MSGIETLVRDLLALELPLLVALDVDGTLSPIVRDPDQAQIPDDTLATLRALAALPSVRVALITGRDLSSLGRMEQLEGVWRAVEHGGVVLAPGENPKARVIPPEKQDALARFRAWVAQHGGDAFIEYKPQAIAVHVRGIATHDAERAERLLEEAESLATSLGLHVRRGRALREAEAVANDKGEALREVFERSGAATVFFVGDDLTDFPAIDFATEHGIGAFVRSEEQRGTPSSAAAILDGIADVSAVLSSLAERLA